MTGEEGSGAEPLCNLLSVLCQLVTETPDSFIKEASGVVYLHKEVARSCKNCHRFRPLSLRSRLE